MLDEHHFHAIANATLMHIADRLDEAYEDGTLDELDHDEGAGILTIITAQNTTFVLSKHGPSRQLWLASPISGGLHFDYDQNEQTWLLPDARPLKSVLSADLLKSAGLHIIL